MATLFGVTAFVLFGGTGLAVVVVAGFGLFWFVSQQEIRIDTSKAQPITRADSPGLHEILDELSHKAGLEATPEPYLLPTEQMNAATLGSESKPILALTPPILRELSHRELRAVIAHEIFHLAQHDLSFFKLVMMLQLLTVTISRIGWLLLILFFPLVMLGGFRIPPVAIGLLLGAPVVSVFLQAALSRSREYAADLGAVELTGDTEALASGLRKIESRQKELWRQILPVPQQRRRRQNSALRTHPAQEKRIRRLRELEEEGGE